ncbi:MAG: hypothetical protein ACYS0G_11570 [Planctomycetota bacterium]|jgi:hypothetical protein
MQIHTSSLMSHILAARPASSYAPPSPPTAGKNEPADRSLARAAATETAPKSTVAARLQPTGLTDVKGAQPRLAVATPADPPAPPQSESIDLRPPASSPKEHLDRLLADWGKTGSPYDLNGDGTVGIQDLLALLRNWPVPSQPASVTEWHAPTSDTVQMPSPEKSPPPVSNTPEPPANDKSEVPGPGKSEVPAPGGESPPSALSETWPQTLARTPVPAASLAPPTAPDTIDTASQPRWSRLQAFLAERGLNISPLTTAPIQDLLTLFAERTDGSDRKEAVARGVEDPSGRRSPLPLREGRAAAEHIARALVERVSTSGPSEIRHAVESSALAEDQKEIILNRIAAWHPRGLDVSLVG